MIVKRSIAVAVAGCACLMAAAAAAAQTSAPGQRVELHAAFAPDRLGARTTIALDLHVDGGGGGQAPAAMTGLRLLMPPDIGFATSSLGVSQCEPAQLLAAGLSGCSPDARLGYGTAIAVVPLGAEEIAEQAAVDVLMAPSASSQIEALFYVQTSSPVDAQLVLPSVLAEGSAPYGEALDLSLPLIQVWPEGPDLSLQTLSATIGPLGLTYYRSAHGHTVAYHPRGIRLPRRCPAAGFPFAAIAEFLDGTRATATYTIPCPAG